MKDFNIAKYLKENSLGSFGILGAYVDLQALKEEESGLGQQKAMDEPYEGPEDPIDGLGGKLNRHMDVGMNELDGEDMKNAWMEDVDGTEAYTIGKWKCYYEYPGYLAWTYGGIPFDKFGVAATPGIDGKPVTPIQITSDGVTVANGQLDTDEFKNFEDYANAVLPEIKALASEYMGNKRQESNKSEVTKTLKVNIDPEALGELDDDFAKRNNVKIQKPKGFESIDFKSLSPIEKFTMGMAPVKFTGTKDNLAALLDGDLAAQIYGDEDAYFNALNRLFKEPKNMNELEKSKKIYAKDKEIDLTEYDRILEAIDNLLLQGETAQNILQVVKDTLGMNEGIESGDFDGDSDSESENEKHDRMMGLIDTKVFSQLGAIKKEVDDDLKSGMGIYDVFGNLAADPRTRSSVEYLIDDGFDEEDIVDFFSTDFSMQEDDINLADLDTEDVGS